MSNSKKMKVTIPKLPNVDQIDFSLMEKQNSVGDVDQYFSKAEISTMSEYEKLRYRNMKKNYEMMIALGLPALLPEFMKGPRARKRKIKKEESDESDEEWTPDLERRKSNRAQKQTNIFCIPYKEKEKKVKKKTEATKEKVKREKKTDKTVTEKREYPLRKLPRTNYMSLEVPDDDEYLYCEDCNKEYKGDCTVHGELIVVTDSEIPLNVRGTSDQPIYTLPEGLTVKESSIEGAGLGIWAEKDFPIRTRFGPYQGKLVTDIDQAHSSGYAWQVFRDGKPSHFVDAFEKCHSNWMRYVNCARTESEQTLAAFQYRGQIYYRSYKPISTGTELLVWYGQDYGQDLGIVRLDPTWTQFKMVNGEVIYPCLLCHGTAFGSVEYLQKHAKFKHGAVLQPVLPHHIAKRSTPDVTEPKSEHVQGKSHPNRNKSPYQNVMVGQTDIRNYRITDYESSNNSLVINTHNGDCKLYTCNVCGKECTTKQNLGIHYRIHTGDKQYKCDVCGKCFTVSSNLQTHYRIHSVDKPYKCDVCGKCFNQKQHLQTHYRIHSGDKPYKCDVCGKGFNQNSSLQTHYRIHSGDKPYKCDVCGKGFNRNDHLQKHYRIHSGDKPYKCDVCGKVFNQTGNLQKHYRAHSGDKPYKCDVCGKGFIQNCDLQKHYRIHSGDTPYKCDVCGKCFNQNSSLQTHYRIHSGDKPYKCDVCGKCFTQSCSLQTHYRTHSGDKPYKCDVCGKCFIRTNVLQTHHRIHSGDKPYKCDVCGKCFTQSCSLQTHYRTHSGDKPYKCDVCGKCFIRTNVLQTHHRIHSGDKPYRCDVCGKCFSDGSAYRKHCFIHTDNKPYN